MIPLLRLHTWKNARLIHQKVSRALISSQPANFPLSNLSCEYVEHMYEAWLNDPNSVHASWNAYFRTGQYARPPSDLTDLNIHRKAIQHLTDFKLSPLPSSNRDDTYKQFEVNSSGQVKYYPQINSLPIDRQIILKNIAVHLFIRSFQMRGHRWAKIDPLKLYHADLDPKKVFDLSMQLYGLSETDLDEPFMLPASSYIGGDNLELPLREIIKRLEDVYCSSMGIEFMYINNYDPCIWLRQQFETPGITELSNTKKWIALKRLIRATLLERFLNKKWPSEKRFGLEGCESVMTAIKSVIDEASAQGVKTFVIGMPHRGRINVLANVTRQPLHHIFSRFNQDIELAEEAGSGDVKYHLGTLTKRLNRVSQKEVTLILSANPSHLEAVDPVVLGKCRARQFFSNDKDGNHTMAILIHGDAAFAAEGIVYETMDLSDLPAYSTNGTVHIIINNQIGFTTDPSMARSSPYCTDVARVVNAPIFHVNGDDVDAVVYIAEVAAKWRQIYKKDVVIDVVGYRRHGHNEMDDPSFTHPLMYKAIESQVPTMEQYAEKLITRGIIQKDTYENYLKKYTKILEDGFALSQNQHNDVNWIDSEWPEFDKTILDEPTTGVDNSILMQVGECYSRIPDEINIHKGLARILKNRQTMLKDGIVDWALGETLAIGSLLLEKKHVRLSGQDVERGTFSHRHHVLHDQKIAKKTLVPLNQMSHDQAYYTICNSSLCEFGILGFELGYSTENRNGLTIWEAQFGDFANNAQCIIDQFISSGESKWNRQTGLVLLLPHAFEGSGPEHSSGRIERFLMLCDEDWSVIPPITDTFSMDRLRNTNMIIANCTTPANFFHILRRQLALPFRKPLVVFTPKSLLRATDAVSNLDEMTSGTQFKRIITSNLNLDKDKIRRVAFCSGHVYYDVMKRINSLKLNDQIYVVRVEQICPFPSDLVKECLMQFPNADVCWVQEEHKNMGPYMLCSQAINALLKQVKPNDHHSVKYIGRPTAAAVATGNHKQHVKELDNLLTELVTFE